MARTGLAGPNVANVASVARLLTQRRRQPRKAIFVVAALPFLFLGLMSAEYGALPIYFALAGLFVAHLARPTLLGWLAATGIMGAAALLYLTAAASDFLALARGHAPSVFSNSVDSTVFAVLLCFLLTLAGSLLWSRPTPQ